MMFGHLRISKRHLPCIFGISKHGSWCQMTINEGWKTGNHARETKSGIEPQSLIGWGDSDVPSTTSDRRIWHSKIWHFGDKHLIRLTNAGLWTHWPIANHVRLLWKCGPFAVLCLRGWRLKVFFKADAVVLTDITVYLNVPKYTSNTNVIRFSRLLL